MKKLKIGQIALIVLIISTILFAFYQSTLPPAESDETSDSVGDFVGEIIPPETEVGAFVQINLRKIAHFVEFATLGIELAIYIMLFKREKKYILLSYPAAVFIAFLDESIQILSGRGPSVTDIWIDFFGFASFTTLTYLIFLAVLKIIKTVKLKRAEKTESNG